jgi:putative nucleotidyltransferase with HDIG domain
MTANEMVAQVKNLPPVSHAALKLVSLLDNPDAGNEEVVEVLKHDNVLTAKLLRACNSPAIGLQEQVSSVDQAVLILGHTQILQMVTALTFGGPMSSKLPGYAIDADELWRHSLVCANASELLARKNAEFIEPTVAFTVGLLHDIGKLVMGQLLNEESQKAVRGRIAQGLTACEAEREYFGADHAEVGACLLQQWRLPDEIVEAVANHHKPVLEPKPGYSVVTHLGNCLAHLAGATPGWEAYALRGDDKALKFLALDAPAVEQLIIGVQESFVRADKFMHLS